MPVAAVLTSIISYIYSWRSELQTVISSSVESSWKQINKEWIFIQITCTICKTTLYDVIICSQGATIIKIKQTSIYAPNDVVNQRIRAKIKVKNTAAKEACLIPRHRIVNQRIRAK